MEKVQIAISGRQVLVDADMVKRMLKKDALVQASLRIVSALSNAIPTEANAVLQTQLEENSKKIIRLNRTIRKNVEFI